MALASDQVMQKMESGITDMRRCVISMELSLQKLVNDSRSFQQLYKQAQTKDKQTAAAGATGAAGAKASASDTTVANLSRQLASGIGSALLKLLSGKTGSETGPADKAQASAEGAQNAESKEKNKQKELARKLDGKSSIDIMRQAIEDFGGTAEAANQRMYESMSVALKASSEALVKFVTTGKFSFNDLAKTIISNILKIQAQAAVAGLAKFLFGTATSFIGGLASSASSGAASMDGMKVDMRAPMAGDIRYAAGGFDVPAGMNPLTRLHEKEMVLPARYADVIRGLAGNGAASGGGININTSISVSGDGTASQRSDGNGSSQRQLADMINNQTKAIIAREMRQGGLIWNMRMGVA
ncbi:phage tail tape measure C-terminal domain-containing protein [Oxalobacter paraformigenes]|uniref:phage tail tape measure C-terminal domain-containing protein n=1 Tax=Oxalobacter paraformigenes TaxID=556268 RepID=UPI000593478C|nr:phage tail tape measure C-terminal domain-containing protein [Oxalobacter paraformigenes]